MTRVDHKDLVRNAKPWLIHVRFEQGRGAGGVPKAWLAFYQGALDGIKKTFEISTLTKIAVASMRAVCADPNAAHGEDIMPGRDEDYELHHVNGGRIRSLEDLRFETRADQWFVSDCVLTYGTPARYLMNELERSEQ